MYLGSASYRMEVVSCRTQQWSRICFAARSRVYLLPSGTWADCTICLEITEYTLKKLSIIQQRWMDNCLDIYTLKWQHLSDLSTKI